MSTSRNLAKGFLFVYFPKVTVNPAIHTVFFLIINVSVHLKGFLAVYWLYCPDFEIVEQIFAKNIIFVIKVNPFADFHWPYHGRLIGGPS